MARGGTCPSVKSLNSEPRDLQHHTKLCNTNICLALQLCREETKWKIPGNGKQSWADLCQTKALGLGENSTDLSCSSALSINTWNGLLASPCPHFPRLFPFSSVLLRVAGFDFKHRHHYALEPRRDVKLNPPGGACEKHFCCVYAKVFQLFSFHGSWRSASPASSTFAMVFSLQATTWPLIGSNSIDCQSTGVDCSVSTL